VEEVSRRRVVAIGIGGTANLVWVGRKISVQNIKKSSPARLVQRAIDLQSFGS
jgi:predicted DNA repair protein MutK